MNDVKNVITAILSENIGEAQSEGKELRYVTVVHYHAYCDSAVNMISCSRRDYRWE